VLHGLQWRKGVAWIDKTDLGLVQGDYFSESFGSRPFSDSIGKITGQPVSIPFIDALDAFLVQEDQSWNFVDHTPIRTFVEDPSTRPQYYSNIAATVGGVLGLFIPGGE
jgi:hypothetical protein